MFLRDAFEEDRNAEGLQSAMWGRKDRAGVVAGEGRGAAARARFCPAADTARRDPLRQALIDDNTGHVNLLVCEADYKLLKRGIACRRRFSSVRAALGESLPHARFTPVTDWVPEALLTHKRHSGWCSLRC